VDMVLYTLLAGGLGMGLGGLIVALVGATSARTTSVFLAFAAGVMVSVVFDGLIPEAYKLAGVVPVLFGLACGIVLVVMLGYLVDTIQARSAKPRREIHTTPSTLFHTTDVIDTADIVDVSGLYRAGILLFIAMAIHKIPEGIAIGAGGAASHQLGFMLALMLALHNIPEGMALASPLIGGGVSRIRTVGMTVIAGSMMVVGALIGIAVGSVSQTMIGMALSLAAGAMLYAVFGEIVPQTIMLRQDRITTFTLLLGVFVGLFVAYLI